MTNEMLDRANAALGPSREHGARSAATLRDAASLIESLRMKLNAVGELLARNGCDCDCDHDTESHDDDCERCLACRISGAMEK
jgi:hypothetical protein